MKRFLLSIAALLAIVGCAKQEDLVSANFATGPEFGVGIDATRVAIAEDGEGYALTWTAGDEVSVFFNEGGNSQYKYAGETGSTSGKIVSVEVKDGIELDTYYAIYPYHEENDFDGSSALTFPFPAEQSYAKNSFGLGANVMVAKTTAEDKKNFSFKNLCGYIRLEVYGGMMIKSITLTGNNGEILSGDATYDVAAETLTIDGEGQALTLNCGSGVMANATEADATSFWLVVPPMTFEKGFKVVLTASDGATIEKSVETAFEVKRNTVHSPAEPIKWEDTNLIFNAQFNIDGTATDTGRFGLAIDAVTNEDGATPNMVVFKDPSYPHGNVVAFTRMPEFNNKVYTDSFYFIDYSSVSSENEQFKAALEDGFTMELVAKKANHSSGDWMKPFTTNTFGFNYMATQQSNQVGVLACADSDNNSWGAVGGETFPYIPELDVYDHYVYVYHKDENPETGEVKHKIRLYVNGVLKGSREDDGAGCGQRMAIGGFPTYNDAGVIGIQHPFSGVVAMARILDNVADLAVDTESGELKPSEAYAKARYDYLNLPKAEETQIGTPLFDAQFAADGAATNVGSMRNLTINTGKLGETVTTTQRGDVYVATFNNNPAEVDNKVTDSGFYYVDYSSNDAFKSKIKDGFTMELLCRPTVYAGDYWAKPFAASTFYIHHSRSAGSKWGFAGNTAENNWLSYGTTGSFGWFTPVSVGAYNHVLLTYNISGYFVMMVNGERVVSRFAGANEDFNPGNALALGGLPYTDGTVAHPFVGDIAIARIYDETFTQTQAAARYTELTQTIAALNEASKEELSLILDVEFKSDNTAVDKVKGYTITTENTGAGGGLTVGTNGIATFGDDPDNMTYFKIDLAQGDGALKTSMNNGFTIETILASPQANYDPWACPFGGEGFSLIRLGTHWGAGWNINGWNINNAWIHADGVVKPTADQYYHVLYIYDALSGNMSVYRDGVYDQKSALVFTMRENSTMVIGACFGDGDASKVANPWGGDIASFKVYEQAISVLEVPDIYEAAKEDVRKFNSAGLGLLVDVQFNEDGTATDKVKGYTITKETIGNGGTLTVTDGVVTLGDSDDNMSYFKIDLAQGDGALKTSMNNGFTIEFVASSSNNQVGWAGAFGGEGFSLLRLEARYGSKWNINGWVEDGGWRYTDGTIAPAKDRYYHILYAYSAQTGQLDVYRDGVLDTKNANFNFVMRENSTVVIGARIDGGAKQSWNGNIASFAIYEKPTTAAYAEIRYAEVKAQVDALNGVAAQ